MSTETDQGADAVLLALTEVIKGATSPEIQQAQAMLLRRLAQQGDVIPSRIPAPRNVTEVGGWFNLLGEMNENARERRGRGWLPADVADHSGQRPNRPGRQPGGHRAIRLCPIAADGTRRPARGRWHVADVVAAARPAGPDRRHRRATLAPAVAGSRVLGRTFCGPRRSGH